MFRRLAVVVFVLSLFWGLVPLILNEKEEASNPLKGSLKGFLADPHSVGNETKQHLSYQFSGNISISLGKGTDLAGSIEADLMSTLLKKEAKGRRQFMVHLKAQQVKVAFGSAPQPEIARVVRHDLSRGVYMAVSHDGVIEKIRFREDMDPLSKNLMWSILSSGQLAWDASNEWQRVEKDPTGDYLAKYKRETSADGRFIVKTKLRYQKLRGENTSSKSKMSATTNGLFRYVLSGEGRSVARYHGKDEVQLFRSGVLIGRSQYQIASQYKGARRLSFPELQELKAEKNKLLSLPEKKPQGRPSVSIPVSENDLVYEDLLDLMADFKSMGEDEQRVERNTLYLKLKSWVFRNPDKLQDVLEELQHLPASADDWPLWVGALSAVGSEEAQTLLCQLIKSRSDDNALLQLLIPSLGMVASPSLESEFFLKGMIKEFESAGRKDQVQQGYLSLGIMANRLKEDPNQADRFSRLLEENIDKLSRSTNEIDQSSFLSSLGNMGASQALDAVKPYLNHSSKHIRRDAVMALRFMGGTLSRSLIEKTLMHDSNPEVRTAALSALRYRKDRDGMINLLQKAFFVEKNASVRRQMMKSILIEKSQHPEEARAFFSDVASNAELEEGLRRMASRVLEQRF